MLSPSVPDGVSLLCLSKPAGRASFSPPPPHFSTLPPFLFFFILPGPYMDLNRSASHRFTTCIFHVIPIYFFSAAPTFSFNPADSSPSPRLHLCSVYHSSFSPRFSVTSILRGMMCCEGLVATGIDSDRGHGWFILRTHGASSLTDNLSTIDTFL